MKSAACYGVLFGRVLVAAFGIGPAPATQKLGIDRFGGTVRGELYIARICRGPTMQKLRTLLTTCIVFGALSTHAMRHSDRRWESWL